MLEIITKNSKETQKLGELFAKELKSGIVLCLEGDLGAGKTTFTQGFLNGMGTPGPYTSPTFVIMKQYKNIYHFDAYRVSSADILNLGWEEIIQEPRNIVIVEWADRICDIIPKEAIKIKFEWVSKDERKIIIS